LEQIGISFRQHERAFGLSRREMNDLTRRGNIRPETQALGQGDERREHQRNHNHRMKSGRGLPQSKTLSPHLKGFGVRQSSAALAWIGVAHEPIPSAMCLVSRNASMPSMP